MQAIAKIDRKMVDVADVRLIPRDSKKLAKGSKTYASRAEIITNFTMLDITAKNEISIIKAIKKIVILTMLLPLFL
jgi:hypothetical protein